MADGGRVIVGASSGAVSCASAGCGGGSSGNGIGGPRSVRRVDEAVGVAGVIGNGELGWSSVGALGSPVALVGPASGSSGICWGLTPS